METKYIVTYTNSRDSGLQKKEFRYLTSMNAWQNTMAGIVTVIMVEKKDGN